MEYSQNRILMLLNCFFILIFSHSYLESLKIFKDESLVLRKQKSLFNTRWIYGLNESVFHLKCFTNFNFCLLFHIYTLLAIVCLQRRSFWEFVWTLAYQGVNNFLLHLNNNMKNCNDNCRWIMVTVNHEFRL